MTVRHKLRQQIIIDRLNNPENLWLYENLFYNTHINQNVIWDIILKHIDNDWNWNNISQNSNITFDIILNNLDKPWNFRYVGLNKNITWQNIIDNLQYPWDWEYLIDSKPITWNIIKQNLDLFKQNLPWYVFGRNFDFEILDNLGTSVQWNYNNLSRSRIINWDIVIKYKDQNWNWNYLSESHNLDYNVILNNLDQDWNWDKISLNLKITSDMLCNYNNYNLSWHYLSLNDSITEEILINHKDKPWNYSHLSSNKNITKEFVLNNPNKSWEYDILAYNNIIIMDKITGLTALSSCLNLPLEFIKENIDIFTNRQQWHYLCMNKNIDFDFILEYINKPLSWTNISYSHYITYEIVSKNRNLPWDWGQLSRNKNMLDIEVEFKLKAREHIAAYKIQQIWLRAYYNPEYLICQRRLYNEFENLTKV